MTHYTISYDLLEGDEKRKKAVKDVQEYIGMDRWNKLRQIYINDGEKYTLFAMDVLLGVSGYPVQATLDTFKMEVANG